MLALLVLIMPLNNMVGQIDYYANAHQKGVALRYFVELERFFARSRTCRIEREDAFINTYDVSQPDGH